MLRQDRSLDLPLPHHPPSRHAGRPVAADEGDGAAAGAGPRVVPDGPATAPGLHGVPIPLTRFIGRQAEVADLLGLLRTARLVTVTGSGGCGKTRLAAEVATRAAGAGPASAWFVDLAVVGDPALVTGTVATTMRLGDRATTVDALCAAVGAAPTLLVLDSCEHVVEAVAPLAEALLSRCAGLVILATSREELGVTGEAVWRVPSLTCPPTPAAIEAPEDVLGSEAAQLFLERSGTATPTAGGHDAGELAAVATICRQLDGIPLALELAAGLARTMPLAEVSRRLTDRFTVLGLRRRGSVVRQRTLEATVRWSYDLLDDDERDVFLRLSAFVGAFTVEAAEAVAAPADGHIDVRAVLRRLVQTSMVTQLDGGPHSGRFRLLETLRHFATSVVEPEVAQEALHRHAAWCLAVAERAEAHFQAPDAARWLATVEDDLPNLRAALQWSLAAGQLDVGLRLAGTLRWFFGRMGQLGDLRRWLEQVLDRHAPLPADLQLLAITALGTVAFAQGDHRSAGTLAEQGITLAREAGDDRQLEVALLLRGASAVYEGNDARAVRCFEEGIELSRRVGDRWATAWILACWGVTSRRTGQPALAEQQLTESLELFASLGDRHGQALPLVNLAVLAQERADLDEAARLCGLVLALGRELGHPQTLHVATSVLGRVELDRDRLVEARRHLVRSLEGYVGAEHHLTVAIALEGVAILALAVGDAEGAAVLWGASSRLRERYAVPLSPRRAAERDHQLRRVEEALGPDALAAAIARGSALGLDDAVAAGIAAAGALDLGSTGARNRPQR